ncbi:MAG TPA: hypothetical protein VGM19_05910 [Armatimonadota bacterium]|jgi:hypothetical protein
MLANTGRTPGANFPRRTLEEALGYVEGVLNAAGNGTLDEKRLATAVFKLKGVSTLSQVKLAALRQYGLLTGKNAALRPSKLCRELALAEGDKRLLLLQDAFLSCAPFKKLYMNYVKSTPTITNMAIYASTELHINPGKKQEFMDVFVAGLSLAGLGRSDGEQVEVLEAAGPAQPDEIAVESEDEDVISGDGEAPATLKTTPGRSGPVIEIKIDPTLDPDKLEKQLAVLRRFGLV